MKKALLALLLAIATPAAAQEDVAAFFKGKTLRLIVGIGVTPAWQLCLSSSPYHRVSAAATACGYLRLTLPRAPLRA